MYFKHHQLPLVGILCNTNKNTSSQTAPVCSWSRKIILTQTACKISLPRNTKSCDQNHIIINHCRSEVFVVLCCPLLIWGLLKSICQLSTLYLALGHTVGHNSKLCVTALCLCHSLRGLIQSRTDEFHFWTYIYVLVCKSFILTKSFGWKSWLQHNPLKQLRTLKSHPIKVLVFVTDVLRLLFQVSDNITKMFPTENCLLNIMSPEKQGKALLWHLVKTLRNVVTMSPKRHIHNVCVVQTSTNTLK